MAKKPQPLVHVRSVLQRKFLNEVVRIVPAVLESLRDDVFPTYQRRAKSRKNFSELHRLILDERDEEIESAIKVWQSRFNLIAEWIRWAAYATLQEWLTNGDFSRMFFQTSFIVTAPPNWTKPDLEKQFEFTFTHPGWNPFMESWQEAEYGTLDEEYAQDPDYPGGIRQAFEKELKRYRMRIEKLAAEHGFPVHKGYAVEEIWFYPLVRFQVCNISFASLRRDERSPHVNVSGGVTRLAELLELPLRPRNKRGRPSTRTKRRR
jgi:hypothetical protein